MLEEQVVRTIVASPSGIAILQQLTPPLSEILQDLHQCQHLPARASMGSSGRLPSPGRSRVGRILDPGIP